MLYPVTLQIFNFLTALQEGLSTKDHIKCSFVVLSVIAQAVVVRWTP